MDNSDSLTLKLIDNFKAGPNRDELRLRSAAARLSGAFPLPNELETPLLGPKYYNKRPFDDTVLNQNDSLIKKKVRRSMDDTFADSIENSTPRIVAASPWEFRRIQGELLEAKAEIISLESRINQLHNLRKETELVFEQEKLSLKQTIDRDRKTIHELEMKLKKVRRREQMLNEELETKEGASSREKLSLEEKNSKLTEENNKLKESLDQLENRNAELTRDLSSCKIEIDNLKKELEMTGEHLANFKQQVTELKEISNQYEKDKAQLTIAQYKIAELESELKNHSETTAMLQQQQAKLIKCSELERQLTLAKQENSKLREASSKVLYLENVVETLKARLSILDEKEKELRQLKVELGVASGQLVEFKRLADSYVGIEGSGYSQLGAYIKELQESHLVSHNRTTALQARVKTLDEANENATSSINALKSEIAKLKVDAEQSVTTIKRLKKQHAIIMWERDDLRRMVDSLQNETTVLGHDAKVEALEKLVDGYKKRMQEIEADPQSFSHIAGTSRLSVTPETPPSAELETLKKEIDTVRKENTELLAKMEKMQYEFDHRSLKGDFDTRGLKILHFEMNPASEAHAKYEDELTKAQAELVVLREKVKLLKDNQGSQADLTLQAVDRVQQISSKEIEDLKEKVRSAETQKERLVEAFKATSHEFREAVHALLGFNVSPISKKLYKLTSVYAESPSHHFLFQMSERGMELLETEFSKSVKELIELHLCQHHSIPMFLSAITSDLFIKHSQSIIVT